MTQDLGRLRRRIFDALDVQESDRGLDRFINFALLALILANVAAVILETVPSIQARHGDAFDVLEALSIGIFTVEYLLRLWTCVEDPRYADPVRGRVAFVLSPVALIDAAAIVPSYLPGEVFVDFRYARIVRVIRMLRLLKVSRYSRTVRTFARVAESKKADLGLICLFLLLLLIVSASSMYFVEHPAQPTVFTSIPSAMWWAVATLTTAGYGDMIPITPLGRLLGCVIALIGIGFFALPAGVLAAAFAEQLAKEGLPPGACALCEHVTVVSSPVGAADDAPPGMENGLPATKG